MYVRGSRLRRPGELATRSQETIGRRLRGVSPPTCGTTERIMGTLIYSAIASLDGFIEDATGSFDWAAPDEEVHARVRQTLLSDPPPRRSSRRSGSRPKDRLLGDLGNRLQHADPHRASVRPSGGWAAEGGRASPTDGGQRRARRPRHPGRAGGRVPAVPRPDSRLSGQARPPRGRDRPDSRAARSAGLPKQHGLPPLPNREVTRARRAWPSSRRDGRGPHGGGLGRLAVTAARRRPDDRP